MKLGKLSILVSPGVRYWPDTHALDVDLCALAEDLPDVFAGLGDRQLIDIVLNHWSEYHPDKPYRELRVVGIGEPN